MQERALQKARQYRDDVKPHGAKIAFWEVFEVPVLYYSPFWISRLISFSSPNKTRMSSSASTVSDRAMPVASLLTFIFPFSSSSVDLIVVSTITLNLLVRLASF